jgi:transcriptional regulator with XRE-family HTH domain
MSTTPPQTRLAELLAELHLSQAELARRSRTSVTTTARVVHGEQASATVRARIIAAINTKRAELQQPELAASDIFPSG